MFVLFFIAMFLVLGVGVMLLWNAFLPQVLHFTTINYWQALGLMVLCRVLFGGFSFGNMYGNKYEPKPGILKDKLMMMDETDREAFKDEWRKRCERNS
jgi:hypothetical protein